MHDICISLLVAPMFSLGLGYSFQELNGILPQTFLTQVSNSFETFRGISFWACLFAASHWDGMTTMPWSSFFDFDFMSLLLYKSIRLMGRHINLAKSFQRAKRRFQARLICIFFTALTLILCSSSVFHKIKVFIAYLPIEIQLKSSVYSLSTQNWKFNKLCLVLLKRNI